MIQVLHSAFIQNSAFILAALTAIIAIPYIASKYVKETYPENVKKDFISVIHNTKSTPEYIPFLEFSLTGIWILLFIAMPLADAIFIGVVLTILITLAVTDIKYMILPNILTYSLIAIGISYGAIHGNMLGACIGAAFGAGVPLIILGVFYLVSGKVGMGMGDIKLFAGVGACMGVESLWFIIMAANLLGILYAVIVKYHRGTVMSFGQFIVAATLIWMLLPMNVKGFFSII